MEDLRLEVLVSQSCLTLCNPMDCSLPGSSVHGILQARILEWIAIPFYRGCSQPRIEPRSLMPPVLAGGPGGSYGKESDCNVADLDSAPGLGRSPGEGNSYPLQYYGLENSMD